MRELRLVLLGLAALIAILLGAGLLRRAFTHGRTDVAAVTSGAKPSPASAPASGNPSARSAVERAIAASPDYTRFFDRLRLLFPSDYDKTLTALTTGVSPGDVNVDLVAADAVTALRHAHGALAGKATSANLAQIFALQLKEMQALAERDPRLCVAFLYGANGSGFLDFAADHRALVADAAIAGLDAMNSGRMDAVVRSAPTEADFQMLDGALSTKGLTRPQIDALLDGKVADPPIPDTDMCRAGITYLQTLATLPPETRDRLYGLAVDLMAKS